MPVCFYELKDRWFGGSFFILLRRRRLIRKQKGYCTTGQCHCAPADLWTQDSRRVAVHYIGAPIVLEYTLSSNFSLRAFRSRAICDTIYVLDSRSISDARLRISERVDVDLSKA